MRKLTPQEIEQFASRPGVKRIAVENFLMSVGGDEWFDRMNLKSDTKLYNWNKATFDAISDGIELASKEQ